MNFLAHLYLSGEDDGLKIGNFIGDYVKGKNYLDYPAGIQKGILLHRQIDHFTDTHPVVKEASSLFKTGYGRYSGIIADVVFDHFLAADWEKYSEFKLREFTRGIHTLLLANFGVLPPGLQKFLPFLIIHRRLESYSLVPGIQKVLEIMSQYTTLPGETAFAMAVFQNNKNQLKECFSSFMKEITGFVETEFGVGIKKPLSRSGE